MSTTVKKVRTRLIVFASFIFLLMLFACAPKAAVVPEPRKDTVIKAPVMEGWQKQWEETVIEARKEGKVVIHLGAGITSEVRQEFSQRVKDKYGLELEMIGGRGAELAERFLRERKAGLHLADLNISGATVVINSLKPVGVLAPLEPTLILPEVKDPKIWWEERLPFIDKEKLLLNFALYISEGLLINTDLVKKEEIQSYWDLLNPKWKGKISMGDPTIGSSASNWFSGIGLRVLGIDYLRELVKQDIMFSRDQRQINDWVAKGKYPISLASGGAGITKEYIRTGAPLLEFSPKEGAYLSSGFGTLALYDKAPHPNASRIFINWLLSKEGQTIYSKGMDAQSARVDIPTDFLSPGGVRRAGVSYFSTQIEEFQLAQSADQLLAKELFNIR